MIDGFMLTLLVDSLAVLMVLVWCEYHAVDEELTKAALCSAIWMWLVMFLTYIVVCWLNEFVGISIC